MLRHLQVRLERLERRFEARCARSVPRPPLPVSEWAARYLPSYLQRPLSAFHCWLAGALATLHGRRGTRLAVIAPRGSAKSTWASFAYPLYCAVEGYEPYIQIVSDSIGQASLWLEAIKTELEDNPQLAAAYPHASGAGPVWRQDRIRLNNGVVLEALGTLSKIRGRRHRQERPSLIIVDDPENEEHVTSALRRERSWRWFTRAVLNAGTPRTNVLALGTALHRDCLLLRLQKQAGWQARLFRAIVTWPQRMDLWARWEEIATDWENPRRERDAQTYYQAQRAGMDEGAEVLWPQAESLYQLMALRSTIGPSAFAAEKQGDPVDPAACEWPSSYFDYAGFWFEKWPERLEVKTLALDPSKGKDAKKGDYSAFVRYGRDLQGIEYIEADLQRQPTDQIVARGIAHVQAFRPDGFAIEINQFQELLASEFLRAGRQQGVDLPIYQYDNTVNKLVRIRRLGPPLAQQRFRFKARSPGTLLLVQQLKDFPVGDHDDGPDALEMARRLAMNLWNGRQAATEPSRLCV